MAAKYKQVKSKMLNGGIRKFFGLALFFRSSFRVPFFFLRLYKKMFVRASISLTATE